MNSQQSLEGMVRYTILWGENVNTPEARDQRKILKWLNDEEILYQEVPLSSRRSTLYLPVDKIEIVKEKYEPSTTLTDNFYYDILQLWFSGR